MADYQKTISFLIPCRNEESNICEMAAGIIALFEGPLAGYAYEIVFADNCSEDSTRQKIRALCAENPRIRAVFNSVNSRYSVANALSHVSGDACVYMACDFQDPVEVVPELVSEWEDGCEVVCAVKTQSDERSSMYHARGVFYHLMHWLTSIEPYSVDYLDQFTGFGLYSHKMVREYVKVCDANTTLRGFVAEYGYKVGMVSFVQPKRKKGKSKLNLYSLYDLAMLNITSYSKVLIRSSTWVGIALFIIGALVGIFSLMLWAFQIVAIDAVYPLILCLAGLVLGYVGVLGEYVLNINSRISKMNKPLLFEEELINFDDEQCPAGGLHRNPPGN